MGGDGLYERGSPSLVHLGGRAIPFSGWEEFKELMLLRFKSSQEGTLREQLMSLFQTSTM